MPSTPSSSIRIELLSPSMAEPYGNRVMRSLGPGATGELTAK